MKTRSVLVYCPGYPFDPQALMPDRQLAAAAGSLLEAGHQVRIEDFGTVDIVDRLTGSGLSGRMRRTAEGVINNHALNPLGTMQTLWRIRAVDQRFQAALRELCDEVADRLSAERGLHFVALRLARPDDVLPARRIAARLRSLRPKLRIVAFGPLADVFAEELAVSDPSLDGLCLGDVETTLVALAERIDRPEKWAQIPGFISHGRLNSVHEPGPSLMSLPEPTYAPEVYPAMRSGQKLRMFEIEDVRGNRRHPNGSPQTTPDNTIRMKPVAAVCSEMHRLGSLFGTRNFHFVNSWAPASHFHAVAQEIVRRGINVTYSRVGRIEQAVPEMFDALAASGCASMTYAVDTGSQRLLDDYYGNDFTVSMAERVIRASRNAGLYTIAELTYPCPADDYHTRSETVRLITRARPDAAPVGLPIVLPHSTWYRRAAQYGFQLSRGSYLEATAQSRRRAPLPEQRWPRLPFGMGERTTSQIIAEREELVREIEEMMVVADPTTPLLRLARATGYVEREGEFAERIQQEFLSGDAGGVARLVSEFNEVACVPAKRAALRSLDAQRDAAANG